RLDEVVFAPHVGAEERDLHGEPAAARLAGETEPPQRLLREVEVDALVAREEARAREPQRRPADAHVRAVGIEEARRDGAAGGVEEKTRREVECAGDRLRV